MALRFCKCGHRKYKHKYDGYPIDAPTCKGKNLPNYHIDNCRCQEYEPQSNLEYLEGQYSQSVSKNV